MQLGFSLAQAQIAARSYTEAAANALDAEAVAMGFAGVLEWQWQEILLSGRGFDRAHARKVARAYLAGCFPDSFGPGIS